MSAIDTMISHSEECPATGDMSVTFSERGRAVLADLLAMVEVRATTDPLAALEAENVTALLEELRRLA